MDPIQAVLVGAGNRGRFTYGAYARAHPERLRIVALAEPDPGRRASVAAEHGLAPSRVFADWRPLFAAGPPAQAAIVATGDTEHVEPALAAVDAGLHVLLEKPIAPAFDACLRVVEAAERRQRILQIGHVLRFTPFYEGVREVLESDVLGELVTLDLKEHVAWWHFTHSYVRGKFRRRALAAPVLLAKSCHDLDLLAWFADRPARRLASFGSLGHFGAAQAPPGAPERCSDGCPVQADCVHDAVRFYADPDERVASIWPWTDVSPDPSRSARLEALAGGRYGRCVYRCDNDVVDHQVLTCEFDGGLTATFTLHGFASEERRTIRASGTRGELRGVFQDGVLEISRHGRVGVERIGIPATTAFDHHGGDPGLLDHFTDAVKRNAPVAARSSGRAALESHLLGFAAEQARETGQVVDLDAFRARFRAADPTG